MWEIKTFRSEASQETWIARNQARFQIVRLYVNNGYAVEYKRLRIAH